MENTNAEDILTEEILEFRNTSNFHVERGRVQMMQEVLSWLVKQDSPESLIISKGLLREFKDSKVLPIAETLGYFIDINCAYGPNSSQSDHIGETVGSA